MPHNIGTSRLAGKPERGKTDMPAGSPAPLSRHNGPALEGEKRWPRFGSVILLTAVIFIVGQVLGVLLVTALADLTGGKGTHGQALFGSDVLEQFAYATAAYGAMTGVLLWILRRRNLSVRDLGLRGVPHWGDIWRAVVAFVVYISAYTLLLTVVSPLVPGLDVEQKQDVGFDGAGGVSLVLVFIALAVIAPLAEELLMRGFLFTALRQRAKFWLAALLTSVLFASLHLAGGEAGAGPLWIAAFDTFILSLVLCYLREKTGRLWAGIGVHMIKNSIAFLVLFVFHTAG